MSNQTARRAAAAITSAAVAAAGLLAGGGAASAAAYPSSSHSGAVSAVRISDHHNGYRHPHSGDRRSAFDGRGGDDYGYGKRDHDGGRSWIRYDDRDGYQARIDEGRRQWVLDQLRWAEEHGHAHQGSPQHHDRSHG
ncbi:hypothetical protein WJ438_04260 [Streptomyces sp. GD-15H]|uniref:hypothetical protein n=1 Tax=Streptomyces sp. GD-15H TaxID=3129112 RepID=UPI00325548E5